MRFRLAVIGLCFPVALSAQRSAGNRVDATIRQLEERWRVAEQANDTAEFRGLLAPDVTFIGTYGTLRDRAGYIASRSGGWMPPSAQFDIDELRVRPYGATVIVTGRETETGPGARARGRFTHIWARRGGRWTLVALQRTEVTPP
jgi:ketosteroid isomerase-like protein